VQELDRGGRQIGVVLDADGIADDAGLVERVQL
jgi:hypothetical protein